MHIIIILFKITLVIQNGSIKHGIAMNGVMGAIFRMVLMHLMWVIVLMLLMLST